MADLATLGLAVESKSVTQATNVLKLFNKTAADTAKTTQQINVATAHFDQSFRKIAGSLHEAHKQQLELNRSMKEMALSFGAGFLGGSLARFFDPAEIVRSVRETVKSLDELGDAAKRAHVSAKELQVIRFVMEQGTGSAEEADAAFQQLNRNLGVVANTGKGPAASAFKALGIEVRSANGDVKTSEEIFNQLLDIFPKIKSQAQQAAIGGAIFGRAAGPAMATLLDQGTAAIANQQEALESYGIFSDAQLDNVDRLDKKFIALEHTLGFLSKVTLLSIANAFFDLYDGMSNVSDAATHLNGNPGWKDFKEFIFAFLGPEAGKVGTILNTIGDWMDKHGFGTGTVMPALRRGWGVPRPSDLEPGGSLDAVPAPRVEKGDLIAGPAVGLRTQIELENELRQIERDRLNMTRHGRMQEDELTAALEKRADVKREGLKIDFREDSEAEKAAAKAAAAALQRKIAMEGVLQQAQQDIDLIGKGAGETAKMRYQQEQLIALRKSAAEIGVKVDQTEIDAIMATGAALEKLTNKYALLNLQRELAFDRAQMFRSQGDQEIAAQLREVFGDDFMAHWKDVEPQMMRVNQHLREMNEIGNDLVKGGLHDFFDGIRNGEDAFDSLAEAGVNALNKIEDKLIDLVADQVWNQLFKNLASAFGGSFGGFFGPATAAGTAGPFGHARGSVFDRSGNIIPFARGGVVGRPTLFPFARGVGLMGEAGPEAIMPLRRGNDGRLGVSGSSGVNVQFQVVDQRSRGAAVQMQEDRGENGVQIIRAVVRDEMMQNAQPRVMNRAG